MGKLSSLITTLVFIGLIALLVYFCCRVKRKRNLGGTAGNRWSDVFFRQNQTGESATVCPPGQIPTHTYPGPHVGYHHQNDPGHHVPHSVVNPNASFNANPYTQQYPGNVNPPYPIGNPNMPMPGGNFQPQPIYPYAGPQPDDLPPPYSAVVGPNAPKY